MDVHTEAVAISSSTQDAIVSPVGATAMDLGIAQTVQLLTNVQEADTKVQTPLAETVTHMEEPMGAVSFKWTRVATDITVSVIAMARMTAQITGPQIFANFQEVRHYEKLLSYDSTFATDLRPN